MYEEHGKGEAGDFLPWREKTINLNKFFPLRIKYKSYYPIALKKENKKKRNQL